MAQVSLNNIRKVYPNGYEAVVPTSFDIADGEFVVLVGPSGCGKSTLLRMVAGLEEISEGALSIGDRNVNHVDPADRDIAMVFQNYALYPHMTVRKNIGYGLKNRKIASSEIEAKVQTAAKMLNLTEFLDRKPSQLSGGQRQRVAMGRAVVRDPSLFLFDEPLSNLDAKLRHQMRIEIKALQRRLGVTSIYVTHDQVEAMTMADRIVVLNAGRIEQIGTPAEIYHRPSSTFVASFMGAPPMNLLAGTSVGGRVELSGDISVAATAAVGPVILGIRPEDIEIGPSCDISFTVDIVEELGAHRLLHGQMDGQDFTIHVGKDVVVSAGPIRMSINPDAVVLFDAENRSGAMITRQVADLPPITDADRCRILDAPRTADAHRALLAQIPAMNAVQLGGTASANTLPLQFTVAAWNVERCLFPEEAAAQLGPVAPDIVLLSEVDHGMARTGQRHTTEVVAAQLGMAYAFGVEFHELDLGGATERAFCRDDFNALGWHGNAILSSVPFERTALIRLDDHGHWFACGTATVDPEQPRLGGRMAIAAVVPTQSGPLCVVSTHLESNADAAHRHMQMQRLLDAIDTFAPDMPVVLGGDLNTGNNMPPHFDWRDETLFSFAEDRGYTWDFTAPGKTTRPSLITPHPDRAMKLDWLAGRGLKSRDSGIAPSTMADGKPLSDHDFVWCKVEISE